MKWFCISVLLFVFSLTKCTSMSFDELQDFSNFLKETSLLDQPLKKNPADESDEEDPISDHAWEQSGRFEGDLILNDRQRQLILKDVAEGLSRNGLKDSTKRWPNNEVIYYIQKEHFSGDQIQAIMSGIEDLAQASCIKFRPYRKGDRDAVVVQGSRRGCFSQVGYQGGYQVLNLSGRHPAGRGCFRHGTVVHEFLHTLGFYHMQSSPDRDDYIDVLWENIIQPARHNFRKFNLYAVSDFGVGYDYDSVLHYSRKAFSSNGGDTLVPKKGGASIGQRIGLSDKDTAKLNKMYCDADSDNLEAEEVVPHTSATKKQKKPKNKPFEGHGIGYHQGKTVVIKLPAAETYRLPDTPSYHVFDYFSKAPQAMSPTLIEGLGVGKEITYSYTLPAVFQTYKPKVPILTDSTLLSTPNTAIVPKAIQETDKNKEVAVNLPKPDVKSNSKETLENFDEETTKTKEPKSGHDDFKETFNKIGEVVKSKFHPDLYKPNIDYSEYYNPVNLIPVTKTDSYLNYNPVSKTIKDYSPKENTNLKLTRQFIETLYQPTLIHSKDDKRDSFDHDKHEIKRDTEGESEPVPKDEKTFGEVHLSFGEKYPRKKLEELRGIYSLKPEYASLKYLANRQDYSDYYNLKDMVHPDRKSAPHLLFGEPVPFTATWLQNNDKNIAPNPHSNIHAAVLNEEKNPVTHSSKLHNSNTEHESNTEEQYRSELIKSHDNRKNVESNENSPKSYEVAESIKENIETATEKPKIEESETDSTDSTDNDNHNLEDRLPKILESYTNFDSYDIASPHITSEYATDDSFSEEGPNDSSEAEYD